MRVATTWIVGHSGMMSLGHEDGHALKPLSIFSCWLVCQPCAQALLCILPCKAGSVG